MRLETWFSGGGLADIGFKLAGLTPVRAVELCPDIAAVYIANLGNHCVIADVRDYARNLDGLQVDWFHVSPPCTNASTANPNRGETVLDRELAQSVCVGITHRKPEFFSLENVWMYRHFDSFKIIYKCLQDTGYSVQYWHLNSANYGVPQTRKRLILIASRTQQVIRPHPTHSKEPDLFLQPWVSWAEAIDELDLPLDKFPKWQSDRIRQKLGREYFELDSLLADGKGNSSGQFVTVVGGDYPSFTIVVASLSKQVLRCWDGSQARRLTRRAIARIQSTPDWYKLPDSRNLAGKIIGNGVPPLLMKEVVKSQLGG